MHSKKRLRKYYPQITDELLRKFYGQAKSKRTRELWNKLVISNVSFHISDKNGVRFHFELMSSMTHGDSVTDNITLQELFHQTR